MPCDIHQKANIFSNLKTIIYIILQSHKGLESISELPGPLYCHRSCYPRDTKHQLFSSIVCYYLLKTILLFQIKEHKNYSVLKRTVKLQTTQPPIILGGFFLGRSPRKPHTGALSFRCRRPGNSTGRRLHESVTYSSHSQFQATATRPTLAHSRATAKPTEGKVASQP